MFNIMNLILNSLKNFVSGDIVSSVVILSDKSCDVYLSQPEF